MHLGAAAGYGLHDMFAGLTSHGPFKVSISCCCSQVVNGTYLGCDAVCAVCWNHTPEAPAAEADALHCLSKRLARQEMSRVWHCHYNHMLEYKIPVR